MRNLKNGRYVEANDEFRTDSTELGLTLRASTGEDVLEL